MTADRQKGKIRVAVVGVGHMGEIHAGIYSRMPEVELVAVVDTRAERAREVGERYECAAGSDVEMITGRVDAVSVAVPTDAHYQVAAPLLKAGISVLLEKPITTALEEAEELLQVSRAQGLILQIGHVERFNSAFQELEKRIKNPRFIECHRLGAFTPRGTEVGVVLDLMIHDLDIILHLVRSPVERVEGVGVKVLSRYEDIANARLYFADGCIANITSSRVSDEKMRRIRIFQPDSYISLDYLTQGISIYRKEADSIEKEEIAIPREEPLRQELEHFVSCVSSGKEPLVPGETGRDVLVVALDIARQIKL